ncbi:MAG: hypothetical protein QOD77_1074 [Thermoplasmata archaeon]|jgi:hypothetical protein|nr:hypothetical protein [Thermoplasmata archaeon]
MPNETLASVSVPKELMERADRLMEKFPALGFRSRGRFTAAALQEYLAVMEQRAYHMMILEGPNADAGAPKGALESLREPLPDAGRRRKARR